MPFTVRAIAEAAVALRHHTTEIEDTVEPSIAQIKDYLKSKPVVKPETAEMAEKMMLHIEQTKILDILTQKATQYTKLLIDLIGKRDDAQKVNISGKDGKRILGLMRNMPLTYYRILASEARAAQRSEAGRHSKVYELQVPVYEPITVTQCFFSAKYGVYFYSGLIEETNLITFSAHDNEIKVGDILDNYMFVPTKHVDNNTTRGYIKKTKIKKVG